MYNFLTTVKRLYIRFVSSNEEPVGGTYFHVTQATTKKSKYPAALPRPSASEASSRWTQSSTLWFTTFYFTQFLHNYATKRLKSNHYSIFLPFRTVVPVQWYGGDRGDWVCYNLGMRI